MLERLKRLLAKPGKQHGASAPLVLRAPRQQPASRGLAFAAELEGCAELRVHVLADKVRLAQCMPTPLPFIPMAILLAARAGRDLHIESPVDDAWWLTLREALAPLVAAYYDFREPALTREQRAEAPPPSGSSRGLLFSAGVDSFFSLGRIQAAGTPPDCLICVNAGAHGPHQHAFTRKLAVVEEIARAQGLAALAVDTNFHDLFPLPHIKAHTFRNFSATLALHPIVGQLVYSASSVFEEIDWKGSKAERLSALDHLVTGSLLPPSLAVTHVGWGTTRVAKTAEVAGIPLAEAFLDVCARQRYQAERPADAPPNCGECPKCLRTLLTLEYFGALPRFATCFPRGLAGARRAEMLVKLGASANPLDREVVTLLSKGASGAPDGR
jgi:hypothetical protein